MQTGLFCVLFGAVVTAAIISAIVYKDHAVVKNKEL